ncbi:MAG: uncharacterized protein KVP18_003148 [Porospora cf. gigantea A]|uniref:uncharacterized protein n=1 Tax=Porospora cf. gigantea A TaxID=2853593 RepID=UPI00355ACC68|nr:MAG: hypothetical protein KVP18_003148 [Porospora cf. gigantea A]
MLEAVLEALVQLHDFSNVYLRRQGIYRIAFELSLVSDSPDENRFLFKPRGLATSPLFLPPDASQPPEVTKSVHLTHAAQFSGHVWTSSSFWVRYSDEVVLLNDTALLSIEVPLDRVDIMSRSLQLQVRLLFSDSCPPQFKSGNTKQAESYPMTEVACLCLILESPFIGARLTRKLTFSSPYSSISTITVTTCLTRISSSWRSCLLVPSSDETVDKTEHYMQVSPPKSTRAAVEDVYDVLSDPPLNISKHEAVYIYCLRQALGAYCSLVEFFYDDFLGMFPVACEDDLRRMLGSLGPSMPGQSLSLGKATLVFDSNVTFARWSMDSSDGPSFSVEWCKLDWEASRCAEPLHLSMASLPSDLESLLARMKVDLDAVFVGVQAVWHTVQLLSSMFPNLVREEGLLKSEVADLVKWELCVIEDDSHLVCDKAINLRKSALTSLPKPVRSRFDDKDICWPHLFLERSPAIPNPMHNIQRTNCNDSVHLVVLVHGLDGRGADLQHFRDALREVNEDILTWSSTWNELHTSGSIDESGRRLAEEITKFVQSTCPGSSLGQVRSSC